MRAHLIVSATTVLSLGLLGAANAAAADPDTVTVTPGAGAGSTSQTAAHQRAATAVTLGQTGTGNTCSGGPSIGALLGTEGAGGASYVAGFDGVLTSFSYIANGIAGQVQAVVFANGVAANQKVTAAYSARQTVTVSANNTFPTQLPIKAGERLGLVIRGSGMMCAGPGVSGDALGVAFYDPELNPTMTHSGPANIRPDISAVLEPDVDGDTFGDVSQDACPQSKLTQAACPPPDTTITKAPKKKSTKRKARIKFSASVAGSTFTCAVDGKAAVPCTSPFKKRYKYGKHSVVITATSPFGIVDPTPVTVAFKVKRPRN